MPPISRFQSAFSTCASSPIPSTSASHSRKSRYRTRSVRGFTACIAPASFLGPTPAPAPRGPAAPTPPPDPPWAPPPPQRAASRPLQPDLDHLALVLGRATNVGQRVALGGRRLPRFAQDGVR